MAAPQIIYLLFLLLVAATSPFAHGKTITFNGGAVAIRYGLLTALLYWGGFFA